MADEQDRQGEQQNQQQGAEGRASAPGGRDPQSEQGGAQDHGVYATAQGSAPIPLSVLDLATVGSGLT
ncbi:alkanal monooxygenase, partial [Streptomyces sp. 2MCAF27]